MLRIHIEIPKSGLNDYCKYILIIYYNKLLLGYYLLHLLDKSISYIEGGNLGALSRICKQYVLWGIV